MRFFRISSMLSVEFCANTRNKWSDQYMSIHTLISDDWRLQVEASQGMRWLSGDIFHRDRWLAVLPNCTLPNTSLAECNYVLLPYSNRIRDGRFEFQGKVIQLENSQKHAIHGTLRDQPWEILSASKSQLLAKFDSRGAQPINWPWALSAVCEMSIEESALSCRLQVTNEDTTAMPMGGGWHPYFVRQLMREPAQLTIPVSSVYPDTNGDCLPTGAPEALPDILTFLDNKKLPADQRIDHCFAGLRGPMKIRWEDAGVTLTLHASENCTHAVLYNPDQPWFALEPVTHANDAINLVQRGIDAGLETLEPGKTWQAELQLRVTKH